MNTNDLKYLDINEFMKSGKPVYMLGATSKTSKGLLEMFSKADLKFTEIWDEKWLNIKNSTDYQAIKAFYDENDYEIKPIPSNLDWLEEGIIIAAVEERFQRRWINYCKASKHLIIDGYDVVFYPQYIECLNKHSSHDEMLALCKKCPASFRSCPVRRASYEANGEHKDKVIRHIAFKAGYICNLKCKYCCEYIPSFEQHHKKKFDVSGNINTLRILTESLEYINRLSFSGGDVMLNRELGVLIDYVSAAKNIGDIYILTNGTYLPHSDVLDAIERNSKNVRIVINNYNINNCGEKLIPELEKRGITFFLRDNAGWYDLSDKSFKNRSVTELKELYANCSFDKNDGYYYIVFDGKMSMRCGVANGLLYYLDKFDECTEDHIDLKKFSTEELPSAITKLEDREYLDICNYCTGCTDETRTLGAAENQL
ncbi:MAG: radical SAM protein [Oscillospiraceae bacterium]